ncbi:MAG: ATP-binding cassette domain-containing protein [Lachnospiraceae bacterium]|nr:ATP-binding cassette domain-containing protein [Lachnospiraceae bacterium]
MITIKDLSFGFGKKQVLNHIECELENGIYGVLGPNGAGKTTLFRCIAGLYCDYSGEIEINGKLQKKEKINVGYLPQKFSLFPDVSVWENMCYFAALKQIAKEKREENINKSLEMVHMLDYAKVSGAKLSGGMLRRVGIAQAILGTPEILLLDEPTVGLDPEERIHYKEIISKLDSNMVVLMSTHIVEDVEACCKEILVIKNEGIGYIGTGDNLRKQASGKVYEIGSHEYCYNEKDYIEKEYEKETGITKRILTSRKNSYKAVEPTIEDGYLCVIKEI